MYPHGMPRPAPVELLAQCSVWDRLDGGTLFVACSGGRDSVALALAAHELLHDRVFRARFTHPPQLVLWHLDHGLRAESAADARFVSGLAAQLDLPCITEQANLSQAAGEPGVNLEALAREQRYARLLLLLKQPVEGTTLAAPRFAMTAHHLGDQAETVLHHLVRGTALPGLRGIAPVYQDRVYRPWLALEPRAIQYYLAQREQTYRVDTTNYDLRLTRNRLRHQILPQLRELNLRVDLHLARLAGLAAEAGRLIDTALCSLQPALATELDLASRLPLLAVPVGVYRVLHAGTDRVAPELLAAMVQRCLRDLLGSLRYDDYLQLNNWAANPVRSVVCRNLEITAIENGLVTVQSLQHPHLNYPGLTLRQDAEACSLSGLCARLSPASQAPSDEVLAASGAPWHIKSWPLDLPAILAAQPGVTEFSCLLPDTVAVPLSLRLPRPGDRIVLPQGSTKKLGDVFTDAKIPLSFRRAWAVLVDARDAVLWVPALADSAAMREGKLHPAWLVTLRPAG